MYIYIFFNGPRLWKPSTDLIDMLILRRGLVATIDELN